MLGKLGRCVPLKLTEHSRWWSSTSIYMPLWLERSLARFSFLVVSVKGDSSVCHCVLFGVTPPNFVLLLNVFSRSLYVFAAPYRL